MKKMFFHSVILEKAQREGKKKNKRTMKEKMNERKELLPKEKIERKKQRIKRLKMKWKKIRKGKPTRKIKRE